MMAKNVLTPSQDVLTRRFYREVALKLEGLLPSNPDNARQLRRICLLLLNYDQIGSGAYITKGTSVSVKFNSRDFSAYPDEWPADALRAEEALRNEEDNDTDTSEASAGEPGESTEVREAVLREDVPELEGRRTLGDPDERDEDRFTDEGGSTVRDTTSEDK